MHNHLSSPSNWRAGRVRGLSENKPTHTQTNKPTRGGKEVRTQARWACVVCACIRLLPHTSLPAHQRKEALAKVRRSQRPHVTFGPRKGVVCRPQTAPPTPPHAPTNCDVRKTRSGARRTSSHAHTAEGQSRWKEGWKNAGGEVRVGGGEEEAQGKRTA